MFLYQKLKYKEISLDKLEQTIMNENPRFLTFDTETTGLEFMEDIPFLFVLSFNNYYSIFEPTDENMATFYQAIKTLPYNFAHNAKYDWHILYNNGTEIPKEIKLADGLTVARLTTFADEETGIGLEELGTRYVDENAKFAAEVIKKKLKEMTTKRWNNAKKILKVILKENNLFLKDIIPQYKKRVNFLTYEHQKYFDVMDELYKKPSYLDVYLENKELMESYAIDDAVILNEYLKKALPVLEKTSGLSGVFEQECQLIREVGKIERVGLRVDIGYLLEKREVVEKYINETYKKLWQLTGQEFTSGQHEVIMKLMGDKFNIVMSNCDKDALKEIVNSENAGSMLTLNKVVPNQRELLAQAIEIAKYIIELRRLDKWLSTYIDGMLNRIRDGRIHTDIKNYGTVTGRVSSNLQQQPKDALFDRENNELFHPRKVFINDEGYTTYYFDYSQMELRVQAHYVLLFSDETSKLVRAFMPQNCVDINGKLFEYGKDNIEDVWFTETGEIWQPVDVHTETTRVAFPDIPIDDPDFHHYRDLGKRCNFLKNYAGGVDAIMDALDISKELADLLDKAYYTAFPEIKKYYQSYVNNTLYKYGYIDNLYNRRYFIQSSRNYYKVYNYLVQGSCADILKNKELAVAKLLEGTNSKMLLPIHDELQISIAHGEEYLIEKIKEVMDDIDLNVPMLCDVEKTDTNWAEKYEVSYE